MHRCLPRFVIFVARVLVAMASILPGVAAPVRIVDSKLGARFNLPIYEWVDKNRSLKGTIVAVHGLTLYADCWNDLAMHLAARGYRVFALDIRGFGRWRTEGSKFGGNGKIEIEQSQQDLLDLVTTLHLTNPNQRLFCLGESTGSNMILLLIDEHPDLVNGAILVSPCYKRRMHPKMRMAVDIPEELIMLNKLLNLTPYAAPYLTNDPALAQACNNDPKINRRMTPMDLVKTNLFCDEAISKASKLPANFPLLIIAGSQDKMFKSTELPKAIKKFGTNNISLNLLPGKGHLLLEHQRVHRSSASLIDSWLQKQ